MDRGAWWAIQSMGSLKSQIWLSDKNKAVKGSQTFQCLVFWQKMKETKKMKVTRGRKEKKMGGGGLWEANNREKTGGQASCSTITGPPCRPDRGCSCPFTHQVGPPCMIYEQGLAVFQHSPLISRSTDLDITILGVLDSQQSILNQPNDLAFISDHLHLTFFHHFPVRGSFSAFASTLLPSSSRLFLPPQGLNFQDTRLGRTTCLSDPPSPFSSTGD